MPPATASNFPMPVPEPLRPFPTMAVDDPSNPSRAVCRVWSSDLGSHGNPSKRQGSCPAGFWEIPCNIPSRRVSRRKTTGRSRVPLSRPSQWGCGGRCLGKTYSSNPQGALKPNPCGRARQVCHSAGGPNVRSPSAGPGCKRMPSVVAPCADLGAAEGSWNQTQRKGSLIQSRECLLRRAPPGVPQFRVESRRPFAPISRSGHIPGSPNGSLRTSAGI